MWKPEIHGGKRNHDASRVLGFQIPFLAFAFSVRQTAIRKNESGLELQSVI
jgi:hypothetical protein